MAKVKMYTRLGGFMMLIIVCLFACKTEVVFDFDEELAADIAEIESFLEKNNIDALIHESSARYTLVEGGTGEIPLPGDTVAYLFKTWLLDSTLLETNHKEYENLAGTLNWYIADTLRGALPPYQYTFPPILSLAVSLTPEEGIVRTFLPSYLAYGLEGRPWASIPIQPNSPVMVEIQLLELRRQ